MNFYEKFLYALDDKFTKTISVRDPLWGNIEIPPKIYVLSQTSVFQRLYKIKQLGPTFFVYPGATHSRANHSFGVFHIAAKFIAILQEKGASQWTTKEGLISFLCAALLHDAGHFPYTHALKELPLKSHETLTAELIETTELKELIIQAGGNPIQTEQIIDTNIPTTNKETIFYRRILSGVLDPDKLDYLNRDAFFCGVPYGQQDIDFILTGILPDIDEGIIIKDKNIISVENILFSKYCMYRSVYWHKNIRIATGMAKKILFSLLNEKKIEPEQLYSLDDESLFSLMEEKLPQNSFLLKGLKTGTIYQTFFETNFDTINETHKKLQSLNFRTQQEKIIAEQISKQGYKCSEEQILIDIPENISFESNLNVVINSNYFDKIDSCNKKIQFSNSETVFSQQTIKEFVSTLRKIRIAISPEVKIPLQNLILLAKETNLD